MGQRDQERRARAANYREKKAEEKREAVEMRRLEEENLGQRRMEEPKASN